MKYEVYFNNEKCFQSDRITPCIEKCLEIIGAISFKAFNVNNYISIFEPERSKFVWNSRKSFNN